MKSQRSVPMGVLALLFFVLHEAAYVYRGQPENGLWSCNVALLAVGFGLLIPSAIINAIGTFWLTAGLPLWIYYVATSDDFVPTTLLTHLGGVVFGYAGMRKLGLPRFSWTAAAAALFGLILLSRPLNSPAENVNFSYNVYSGLEKVFPSYWIYMLLLGSAFIAVFAALQWSLPKLGFPRRCRRTQTTGQ